MRVIWAAFLVALLPGIAAAQQSRSRSSEAPTLPTIGLPLPQIGLPLPSIGLPPGPTDTRSVAKDRPSPPPRNTHRGKGRRPHARGTAIYIGPGYWWDGYSSPQSAAAPEPASEPAGNAQPTPTGTLQLDVLPHDAQMYVDGYYVGTPDDANGALTLEAGPHSIEIRAEGYETTSLDVMIEQGRTITYRGALSRTKAAPAAEPPATKEPEPATRKPVYVIPGCYLGNVPPAEAGLPPTCDPSRAKVIQPS